MVSLEKLVTPTAIQTWWDNTNANQQAYLGERLFPATKIQGLEISKIGGRAGLPVQLKASAFDTQATYRDRLTVEKTTQQLPFFRERMKIDEKTRQQILAIGNDSVLAGFLGYIFDDVGNLLIGARATRERMVMELLSTGHVKMNSNGVKLDYDYGLSKNQKVTPAVDWTDTQNSNPVNDLADWVDYARTKFHIGLGYVVMTTKTFNLIKANKAVQQMLYPNSPNAGALLVTRNQVRDLIQNAAGLTVLFNDAAYADEVGGAGKQFYPDYTVTLLPTGGVCGRMVFGTTPEEIDLATRAKTAADTRIVDTGVAVYTRVIDHPVNVEVIVSQICLPSFGADVADGAGSIIIGKVG